MSTPQGQQCTNVGTMASSSQQNQVTATYSPFSPVVHSVPCSNGIQTFGVYRAIKEKPGASTKSSPTFKTF